MRRASLLTLLVLIFCCVLPCAGAVIMEINATPLQAHAGDSVLLTGRITGLKTIAVYLFVTGPELDNRGVTLENLNFPAGQGLFTTAPVNMEDGTWKYIWDTSVILGTIKPGTYTIYAVSTPVGRLRFAKTEYAKVEIEFLPSDTNTANVPIDPLVPLAAIITAICVGTWLIRRKNSS